MGFRHNQPHIIDMDPAHHNGVNISYALGVAAMSEGVHPLTLEEQSAVLGMALGKAIDDRSIIELQGAIALAGASADTNNGIIPDDPETKRHTSLARVRKFVRDELDRAEKPPIFHPYRQLLLDRIEGARSRNYKTGRTDLSF